MRRRPPSRPENESREAVTRQEYEILMSNVAKKLVEVEERLLVLEAEKQLLIRGRAALERAEHHDHDHTHDTHTHEGDE